MQKRTRALNLSSSQFQYLNHEILFERFQDVVDIADKIWQEAIIRVCAQKAIKVVILDNLFCLSPEIDENDGVSWSAQLLNWVLSMRRRGVAVVFIQHAGRCGDNMRGGTPGGKIPPTGLSGWISRSKTARKLGRSL
jgi:hypothetical protein